MLTRKAFKAPSCDQRSTVRSTALPRRELLFNSFLVVGLANGSAAYAKDAKEAQAEKEARRKKLREAAEKQKETGKDVQVFDMPESSLSEDSRSPNFRAIRLAQGR